ncbi:hypothetical protein [Sinisalibacter aestuarii]|uniref:PH domain-containing protein n=1 Tax=Sinisalibacter aestuarii TaxID=2949426 RepID=A0ABQ5LWW9_9RHOB|nr:hypothetical protein [Sinisalibacter aestuarii]GKY89480.1 hypothetical protein STA1M1_33490 [Sinisalibacter aestuarii]
MSATANEFEFGSRPSLGADGAGGPFVVSTESGYAIRAGAPRQGARAVLASGARFAGTFLLIAAAGLLIVPDGDASNGLVSMKLAALVMFAVTGILLLNVGAEGDYPELHVDTVAGQIQIGRRHLRGDFDPRVTLDFADVSSVYLLRSKDHSRPARLFLRIGGGDDAIEVASGREASLDHLRTMLVRDLAQAAAD